MVTRVHTTTHDDFDGTTDSVDTYRFAIEGADYEIDLSPANLGRLRDALAPFTTAGRRLPKAGKATSSRVNTGPARRHGAGTTDGKAERAAVRAWWATNWQDHDLPEPKSRGAVPGRVFDAYRAAQAAGSI